MPKKGQKFSKYILEEKQRFIKMVREEGYSTYEITREFGIPNSSIKNRLYSAEKSLSVSERGRARNDDKIDYKSRYEILKKYRAFLKNQQEKRYKSKYKLKDLFDVLNISESNYFKYYKQIDKDYDEYLLIREIFNESKGTYGYRRIEKGLLKKWGLIMNHKKIQRIMKKYNLRPQYTKRVKNKSYKRIEENVKPNLINRNFNTDAPNKIWTTDITYLIYNNKRAYLSTILDLYDRKIVAYKISDRKDLNIVIDTLNEAIQKRKNVQGVILHSDQGFQYTYFQYKKIVNLME